MKDQRSIDRFLADRLGDGGIPLPHAFYDDMHSFASRTRQRPHWLALMKEPPMRYRSNLAVGSPTARATALVAVTMLVALLATGALVVGQSPSPAPAERGAAPQPPVEFTGTWCTGPTVAPNRSGSDEPPIAVGDEGMTLIRNRRGAWFNSVTMSDPRLEGDAYQTYESDTYTLPGAETRLAVGAFTLTIVNEDGAWVSEQYDATFADGTGTEIHPTVLVGEDAYEGLIAIMDHTPSPTCGEVWGAIFEAAPVPAPYRPE